MQRDLFLSVFKRAVWPNLYYAGAFLVGGAALENGGLLRLVNHNVASVDPEIVSGIGWVLIMALAFTSGGKQATPF